MIAWILHLHITHPFLGATPVGSWSASGSAANHPGVRTVDWKWADGMVACGYPGQTTETFAPGRQVGGPPPADERLRDQSGCS